MNTNLEKTRTDKTKEAEEVFKKLGIEYESNYLILNKLIELGEDKPKKEKLFWTRLSINSNIGSIIE